MSSGHACSGHVGALCPKQAASALGRKIACDLTGDIKIARNEQHTIPQDEGKVHQDVRMFHIDRSESILSSQLAVDLYWSPEQLLS